VLKIEHLTPGFQDMLEMRPPVGLGINLGGDIAYCFNQLCGGVISQHLGHGRIDGQKATARRGSEKTNGGIVK